MHLIHSHGYFTEQRRKWETPGNQRRQYTRKYMQWTYMCSACTAITYLEHFLAYTPFLPAGRSITGGLNEMLLAAIRRTRPKKHIRELSGNSNDCQ